MAGKKVRNSFWVVQCVFFRRKENVSTVVFRFKQDFRFNPIPTDHRRNQPIYERHVTKSGRNRVKQDFTLPKMNALMNE